jgi:uncharacterized membrane protein YdfJ with MMPL/SSD domain
VGAARVTGTTAGTVDFTERITGRMVWLILAVVVISFILLTTAFRSVVIATKAALLNLLSIGAAYGVIVAIFQWGWGESLIGVDRDRRPAPRRRGRHRRHRPGHHHRGGDHGPAGRPGLVDAALAGADRPAPAVRGQHRAGRTCAGRPGRDQGHGRDGDGGRVRGAPSAIAK